MMAHPFTSGASAPAANDAYRSEIADRNRSRASHVRDRAAAEGTQRYCRAGWRDAGAVRAVADGQSGGVVADRIGNRGRSERLAGQPADRRGRKAVDGNEALRQLLPAGAWRGEAIPGLFAVARKNLGVPGRAIADRRAGLLFDLPLYAHPCGFVAAFR